MAKNKYNPERTPWPPKITAAQKELELKFEFALKNCKKHHFNLSKPYMEENSPGYDNPFTNHSLWGFELGLQYASEGIDHYKSVLEYVIEMINNTDIHEFEYSASNLIERIEVAAREAVREGK